MILTDGNETPLAVAIAAADEHESRHIEPLLDAAVVALPDPTRLVYDKAADSDRLRERLRRRGVDLICPHRSNRKRPKTQDGRKLRRYRHRWKIERSISWLHNYRRLVTRYEHRADLFLGFTKLACMFTILQRF